MKCWQFRFGDFSTFFVPSLMGCFPAVIRLQRKDARRPQPGRTRNRNSKTWRYLSDGVINADYGGMRLSTFGRFKRN